MDTQKNEQMRQVALGRMSWLPRNEVRILLSTILILIKDIRTFGQFAAFCAFQFFIWILIKQFL